MATFQTVSGMHILASKVRSFVFVILLLGTIVFVTLSHILFGENKFNLLNKGRFDATGENWTKTSSNEIYNPGHQQLHIRPIKNQDNKNNKDKDYERNGNKVISEPPVFDVVEHKAGLSNFYDVVANRPGPTVGGKDADNLDIATDMRTKASRNNDSIFLQKPFPIEFHTEATSLHAFKSPYIIDPVHYKSEAVARRLQPTGKRRTIILSCINCRPWFQETGGKNSFNYNRDFSKCPYSDCVFYPHGIRHKEADVVFIYPNITRMPPRPPGQIWVFTLLESPVHHRYPQPYFKWKNVFNWTLSYRRNADLFFPYSALAWKPRHELLGKEEYEKVAMKKTKTAVWVVSNCKTPSNRESYVRTMQKYIDIDIYGRCGKGRVERSDMKSLLNNTYKFYLSFENSFCGEYVTEKLFDRFLGRLHIVPVVRGGFDYEKYLPPRTFVNANRFSNPKDLAIYLKALATDAKAYGELLREKDKLVSLNFKYDWCQLCERLHRGVQPKVIRDIRQEINKEKCWIPK